MISACMPEFWEHYNALPVEVRADEVRAKRKQETRMAFWKQNVDQIITSNGFPLLAHAGSISHERMEQLEHRQPTARRDGCG